LISGFELQLMPACKKVNKPLAGTHEAAGTVQLKFNAPCDDAPFAWVQWRSCPLKNMPESKASSGILGFLE